MSKNSWILEAYDSVEAFNDIAGNLSNVGYDSLDNQFSFIFEEFEETITAFEEADAVELIDGAADLFVTVAGLLQKIEATGVDMKEVIKRVCDNNMSKYIPQGQFVHYHNTLTSTYNTKYKVTVLKNENGKIMKPAAFKPVQLQDLVPVNYIKELK